MLAAREKECQKIGACVVELKYPVGVWLDIFTIVRFHCKAFKTSQHLQAVSIPRSRCVREPAGLP